MTISEQLITILDYIGSKFGIAIDWTSANVMPYLEQLAGKYIQYEIWTSIAWIGFWCGLLLMVSICMIFLHRGAKKEDYGCDTAKTPLAIFGWIVFGFIAFITIIVTGVQIFDIIEAKVLPEKTIIEYLQYLLSTMKN